MDHGLVHGGFELLAVVVGVELEALLDGELPADEAGETLLDIVDIDLRQEADASRVDAHDGGRVAHSRAQDCAVPADGHYDVHVHVRHGHGRYTQDLSRDGIDDHVLVLHAGVSPLDVLLRLGDVGVHQQAVLAVLLDERVPVHGEIEELGLSAGEET